MDIRINITGDRQVGLRFEHFPDALYDDLRREINALSIELFALVEAATPERTGLLRSQERRRVFADNNRISARVDVAGEAGTQDFAKAGALEYGAHRGMKVSAHSMRLDHLWAEKLAWPLTVIVGAYNRTPDIEAYSYLRGPVAAMQPEVLTRLNAVVERNVAEANA